MSLLQVAGEVAEVLGDDTVAQLRADAPSWSGAACRDCGNPIDVGSGAAVVLLIGPAEMPGNLTVMCLTHPACSASELRPMPWEEAQTYYRPGPELTHDVNAVATVWDNRPVLLVSFDAPTVAIEADSGELTDAVAAALLAQGWELVAQMETNPAARPADLVCRYSLAPHPADGRRTGRLEILLGDVEHLADVPAMVSGEPWRTAIEKTGDLAIYVGPLDLHQWGSEVRLDAVDQALRAGRLIGCTTRPHITG